MDFGLSEEQELFRKTVRDFLSRECPRSVVREVEEKKQDYDRELYRKMAGLGWLGLMLPEEYGGCGGTWVDMAIFYEEAGRALLPSPHFSTVVLAGQTLLAFGSEQQKNELLPMMANGEIILTLALTEPEAGSNLSLLTTSAVPEGDDYIISGTKLFVSHAHLAQHIITVAGTGEDGDLALFLVPGPSQGLTCIPLDTLGGDRLNEVVYDRVRVPKGNRLGGPAHGIVDIVDKARIVACAEMVGGAQAAFDLTLDLLKQRVQFGRPIGSFQALQHKMADLALAIEGARWLIYQAAWLNSEGIPCGKESAMAQLEAGRVYTRVTTEAIHIHGAVALMIDHDLPLYYRRAKAAQLNLGYSDCHREAIAQGLGL